VLSAENVLLGKVCA